jgi:hypothetical protein
MRIELRTEIQELRTELRTEVRDIKQVLLRHEVLLTQQAKLFSDHLQTTEAKQNTKMVELEHRVEYPERKVA